LDIIVLKAMKNRALSGYDILSLIHKKFGILLSPGTIYSLLYSLERKGLVKASFNQKARSYTLSEKGEETLKNILNLHNRIIALTSSIF
jgi:DNA-binding PadR family transcriptional regulator